PPTSPGAVHGGGSRSPARPRRRGRPDPPLRRASKNFRVNRRDSAPSPVSTYVGAAEERWRTGMGGWTVQGGTIDGGVGIDPLAAMTARDAAGDLLGPSLLRPSVRLIL